MSRRCLAARRQRAAGQRCRHGASHFRGLNPRAPGALQVFPASHVSPGNRKLVRRHPVELFQTQGRNMRNKDVLRHAGWLASLAFASVAAAHCDISACELRVQVTSTAGFAEAPVSASRELVLADRVQVLDGESFGLISNLGDVTTVGAHSKAGGAFSGGTLTLADGASVASNIHARSVLPESRAVERRARKSPGTETQAMAWKVRFPAPLQAAVLLAPGRAQALEPGYYRELKANTHSVATLRTGTYYFDSLTVARGARLRLD